MWAEREGKYTSLDGRTQELKRVLEPVAGVAQDETIFSQIARKMGRGL
jgi:predicted molibdopterin-dependent oxidoreductase YjgC